MNAFVFANTQDTQRQVKGMNAAFLPLERRPLLIYVLMALDRVTQIEKVVVIGASKEIMRAIESVIFEIPFQKKIIVVEEREGFLESVRFAEIETCKKKASQEGLEMISEPALFLPGNIPFVTSAEISSFIAASDIKKADLYLSIVSQQSSDFPGVKQEDTDPDERKTQSLRPGRLVLARADAMGDPTAIQTVEKQYKKMQSAQTFPAASLEAFLTNIEIDTQTNPPDKLMQLSKIEARLSTFLRTRFKFTETLTAGNTFPAEDAISYQFLLDHFEAWRKHIMTLKTEEGDKVCSISGDACASHDHKH